MAPGSILKKVTLQRLPWLRPKELRAGLNATLSNYGRICDVGVVKDSETGTFLGSGYAILDVSPQLINKDEPPFLELSHVITWVDPDVSRSGDVFILAYWNDMPTYCKYCHESGHSASGCPKSPSGKRVCFLCLKRGHVRAECPERTSAAKRRRNGKPTLDRNTSPSSASVDIVSNLEDTMNSIQVHMAEDQNLPIVNPTHQHSKYATIESSCSPNPNDGICSISSQSKASSPVLTTASPRPNNAKMQAGRSSHNLEEPGQESPCDTVMCENTTESESERLNESDMEMNHEDPQLLVTKPQGTDVSLRRSTRVRTAPDKLNL
ncbi:hypothetical protein G6F55_012545 [Rhizopus delemar]|nr:hypothetical protein G6F55_012545 [Rhizopus delemar]KAG1533070.1 hypothetical protein G6F51_012800 [Rhizopus arrhizus]KAG1503145.1 hypothetical protein G6F52_012305 [Rhizopus delemar]KAG1537132.1 hypothetical protein G6F49_012847 [Rhizopus delemar]KAG1555247.1 hypothetical protein G6F50_012879 [Rhizopus delemar]